MSITAFIRWTECSVISKDAITDVSSNERIRFRVRFDTHAVFDPKWLSGCSSHRGEAPGCECHLHPKLDCRCGIPQKERSDVKMPFEPSLALIDGSDLKISEEKKNSHIARLTAQRRRGLIVDHLKKGCSVTAGRFAPHFLLSFKS